ncbi:hypothetical protein [Rhodoflexus sp.]
MRKAIYFMLFCILTMGFTSCLHAPNTGWTPRKSKPIRTGKPTEYTKVNKRIRMW